MLSFKPFWKHLVSSQNEYGDISDWWDLKAKPEIKNFCIGYSIQRKIARSQTKRFLLASLHHALINKEWEDVAKYREDITAMLNLDAMGFVVRSRFQQNVEEEKASVYHAAREKSKRTNVSALKINGATVTDNSEVEGIVVQYFNALFNGHHNTSLVDTGCPFMPDNGNLSSMLQYLSKLDGQVSVDLEMDVSIDELDQIIRECPSNKSPGLDGISYEFYVVTWSLIKDTFLKVIQCQLDKSHIIASNTMGVTRLISKVKGIPKVDELRPITLLNCDYKILSKLLVLRVKPVLPNVITSGQLCTIGRKKHSFRCQ